jgi:hypothetical protein
MNKNKTKITCTPAENTDVIGRDNVGRFTHGNQGKPKGANHKTTKNLREFITNFLNDKANEIPNMWDELDSKDKLILFMNLCKLVLPKPETTTAPINSDELKQPIWILNNAQNNV